MNDQIEIYGVPEYNEQECRYHFNRMFSDKPKLENWIALSKPISYEMFVQFRAQIFKRSSEYYILPSERNKAKILSHQLGKFLKNNL